MTIKTPTRTLVSVDDAAEYLNCHRATVRRYIASGQLTGYRVGPRAIRLDLGQLDAFVRPMPNAGGVRREVT